MRSVPFFPRRLDPVLDRGERHENPVISPQVPTGCPIWQVVLHDQPDRSLLDAMGVLALGQGQVVHIGVEASPARGALMFGVGEVNLQRSPATGIAHVAQDTLGLSVASRLRPAEGATSATPTSVTLLDKGRGQVLRLQDPFRHIRNIVTWACHGHFSRRSASEVTVGQSRPVTSQIRTNDATVSKNKDLCKACLL